MFADKPRNFVERIQPKGAEYFWGDQKDGGNCVFDSGHWPNLRRNVVIGRVSTCNGEDILL